MTESELIEQLLSLVKGDVEDTGRCNFLVDRLLALCEEYADEERGKSYELGHAAGMEEAEDNSVNRYDEGHEDGYDEGHEAGYERGGAEGTEEGYQQGHDEGYQQGHKEGYDEAVEVGRA